MGLLKNMFATEKSEPHVARTLPTTTNATKQRIKNILGIRELETMPAQAARAFQLASDPKSSMADFVKVIESDDALSSRIIRIANSVFYYRGTAATDIEKAVTNIGLEELKGVLTATMMRSLLHTKHQIRESIWQHSVSTAMFARRLSSLCNNIAEGEAFLAGILHDVGKLVMLTKNPGAYGDVLKLMSVSGLSSIEAEEKIFEVNHVEVGSWAGEAWNFPQSTREAIAFHHSNWPENTRQQKRNIDIPILIKCASIFSHALGIGHRSLHDQAEASAKLELSNAQIQLGMNPEEGQNMLSSLQSLFTREYATFELEDN